MHYITSDPKIMGGKPVIKGTRIPISRILFLLTKDKYTIEMINEEYPHVNKRTLKGAIDEVIENYNQSYAPQKTT